MTSEFINERPPDPSKPTLFRYVCVGCKLTFWRKTKLDTQRFEPRCPVCHEAFRKASKRATWRKHSPEYRTRQAEAKKEAERQAEEAEREIEIEKSGNKTETVPTRQAVHESPKVPQNTPKTTQNVQGRPIFRALPGGRRIVWMADDLVSADLSGSAPSSETTR